MSPLSLRRYRAERLLRQEFAGLRGRVLVVVRSRLRASGVTLDGADLEACYAHAWQGLYAAILAGQEIANPAGWLMLVTFRRAIEEQRARRRVGCDALLAPPGALAGAAAEAEGPAREPDLAAELDDRLVLRRLFEGLRGRLSAREREAAELCYLQGLTRAEAAARMGLSETRMRKLMEGCGAGRPGVAGKVAALAATIREGGWCAEQGSLMRGLAFGILDPAGERYRLALMHGEQCPACRAYVRSLRGLAATLPPVFLPAGLGAGALALVGAASNAGGVPAAGGLGSAALGAGAGASAGAGGAAAGGGWIIAGGPLGAKLAVGCLLAIGVGAGCVALEGGRAGHGASPPGTAPAPALQRGAMQPAPSLSPEAPPPASTVASRTRGPAVAHPGTANPQAAAASAREFTPEQVVGVTPATSAPRQRAVAASSAAPVRSPSPRTEHASAAEAARAQREFSPG